MPEFSPLVEPWRPGALLERTSKHQKRQPFFKRRGEKVDDAHASTTASDSGVHGTLWNAIWSVKRVFFETSGRDASTIDFSSQLKQFQDVVCVTRLHRGNVIEPTCNSVSAAVFEPVDMKGASYGSATAQSVHDSTEDVEADPKVESDAGHQCTENEVSPSFVKPEPSVKPAFLPQSSTSRAQGSPHSTQVVHDAAHDLSCTGAIFLAVCRGKASEGIDFSDDFARVVVSE